VTTTGKTTDNSNFESLQFLVAPVHAAFTDANTGCPIDRIALRNQALCKLGHFYRKLNSSRIHNHLPQARIGGQRNRFAIDHHHFSAGRLCSQRTHHRSADLPRATDDQDAKCHKCLCWRCCTDTDPTIRGGHHT
jgi:hypothetical protein